MYKYLISFLSCSFVISSLAQALAKEIPSKSECEIVEKCIIEKSESILDNLDYSENKFTPGNQKLVHALAKQCQSTTRQISFLVGLLEQESRLMPHKESVKKYVLTQLKGPIKNGEVYESSVSLENEDFQAKLDILGYTTEPNPHDLSIRNILDIAYFADLKDEFLKLTGRTKLEDWWFSTDGISYAFLFTGKGSLRGFIILERKLDYHTITKECMSER